MSRQVYLLGVALVLLALGFLITEAALGSRPGVTEANVKRIRPGMTLGAVEVLLGGPGQFALLPGDKVGYIWEAGSGQAVVELTMTAVSWQSAHGSLRERTLRVRQARWEPSRSPPLDRLRAWLGW
jgi:hypothetical protein